MSDTIIFGETNFRNARRRCGIKIGDRSKHFYVIGKTGMGKTVLLENMAIQDIQAGHGVGIIDPHGEFVERMLDFVPKERINDVIYFNPEDTEFPIAFNIMENIRDDQRPLVAAGLMGVFKKLWPDVWSSRMEYILGNVVLALLEHPGSTLLGINRMLSDKDYRKTVVESVKDDVVKAFWTQEFAKYTDRYTAEATPAIQNKVGQLITNPLIRNIIGQSHSSVDLRKAMDEQKILLINLSKGKIGEENSALIGSMLVTKLYLSAMTRVDIPESERKDFYLYVDEFQNFATPSFANILSEARKYHLDLILTHQYVAQLDEKVRDAVVGNVGTIVTFRIGAADAEMFEKEFAPEVSTEDFVNTPFAQVYVKLMIDGVTSRPFSMNTLPPIPKPTMSYKQEIIKASQRQYGTTQEEVSKNIREWWQPVVSEEDREKERVDKHEKRERSYGYDFAPRERSSHPPVRSDFDRDGSGRPARPDDPSHSGRLPRSPSWQQSQPGRSYESRPPAHNVGRTGLSDPNRMRGAGPPLAPNRPDRSRSSHFDRKPSLPPTPPPQRTISLRDLEPKERRNERPSRPHEQNVQHLAQHSMSANQRSLNVGQSDQKKEKNLDELREMLSQIRPNKQKPPQQGPQNLNPGEPVKL